MKVTFPTGRFIGPGFREIHTVREEEEEVYVMGIFIETKVHRIEEIHGVNIPDPGFDGPEDNENSWPARGEFSFADKTFTVVRDDDIGFWGFRNGEPRTKHQYLADLEEQHIMWVTARHLEGWWDLDHATHTPLRPAIKVSIKDMEEQNKPLMAHLMVDLGFFPSVSQARKNGWDKPLELGRHELGPKKKRAFVEITQ